MKASHLPSTLALGAAIVTLSVGAALAAVATSDAVNVMSGPGQNFKTIGRLDADATVTVSTTSKAWCNIASPTINGWVPCSDLNGLPAPRVNKAAPTTPNTDFQSDPYFGPTIPGGLHTLSNGEFH